MASRETGKQRAARIATDFHQKSDAVQRFRLRIVVTCGIIVTIYLLFAVGRRSAVKFSRGPLAAVHAGWESDCSACHQDFVPISENAWAADWTNAKQTTDHKCSECHATDDHYSSCLLSSKQSASCSSCHIEHQGYDADLSRVHNRACIQCHRDLNAVRSHSTVDHTPIAAQITAFDAEQHPKFRSLKKDLGTIRFNHQLHLSSGIVKNPGDRGAMRVKDLSVQDRKLLGVAERNEEAVVQLECGTCHQPNDENGHTMLPIQYKSHCAACHPLSYEWDNDTSLAPHGSQISELEDHFRRQFSLDFISRNPTLKRPFEATPSVPWKPSKSESNDAMVAEANRFVEKSVASAIEAVTLRCDQCHEFEDSDKRVVKSSAIPSQWFQHAEFNHRSHRFVNCDACHAEAFANGAVDRPDHENVMIAGRDHCIQCHSDTPSEPNAAARTDCVECHRYHTEKKSTSDSNFDQLTMEQR